MAMYLITNDDGIDAPGIKVLGEVVKNLHLPAVVVAPADPHSGCGHQITTRRPVTYEERSPQVYAIGGTPADCTRLGLRYLCPGVKVVLSGINEGGNLGVDEYISGTVAAVREAAVLGVKGIAISQYLERDGEIDWAWSQRVSEMVLTKLLPLPLGVGEFWNVNLPWPGSQKPELVFCTPSRAPLPTGYRHEPGQFCYEGRYTQRDRVPGSDVDVCFSGNIAVTKLSL